MNVSDFLKNVQKIVDSNPTYRTGGDGSDGTCDCIGLIMGALGGTFDMHSTNWFARYQTFGLEPISHDRYEPGVGDILYKARNPSNPKYDLHERYVTGRYATGDLTDYYHVGVVTNTAPLEITHCTSTGNVNGIAYDGTADTWTHVGILKNVDYDEPQADDGTHAAHGLAVVYSENGDPVRMRSKHTIDGGYNTVAKVPPGAPVEILEQAGEWATVRWNGQRGYMMSKYLRVIGMTSTVTDSAPEQTGTVTITISANAAAELLKALGSVL